MEHPTKTRHLLAFSAEFPTTAYPLSPLISETKVIHHSRNCLSLQQHESVLEAFVPSDRQPHVLCEPSFKWNDIRRGSAN